MIKNIIIFIIVLVCEFFLLTSLDFKGDYIAEKTFWKISKELSQVSKNPETAPIFVLNKIANQCQEFLRDFPKSLLASRVQFLRGDVFLLKKDYDKARQEFEKVTTDYPDNTENVTLAMRAIAKSYEIQNDWPHALTIYNDINKKYSSSFVPYRVLLNDQNQDIGLYNNSDENKLNLK